MQHDCLLVGVNSKLEFVGASFTNGANQKLLAYLILLLDLWRAQNLRLVVISDEVVEYSWSQAIALAFKIANVDFEDAVIDRCLLSNEVHKDGRPYICISNLW